MMYCVFCDYGDGKNGVTAVFIIHGTSVCREHANWLIEHTVTHTGQKLYEYRIKDR